MKEIARQKGPERQTTVFEEKKQKRIMEKCYSDESTLKQQQQKERKKERKEKGKGSANTASGLVTGLNKSQRIKWEVTVIINYSKEEDVYRRQM